MWLACHTQQEIADAVGAPRQTITDQLDELPKLEELPKSAKLSALHEDAVGVSQAEIAAATGELSELEALPKL